MARECLQPVLTNVREERMAKVFQWPIYFQEKPAYSLHVLGGEESGSGSGPDLDNLCLCV